MDEDEHESAVPDFVPARIRRGQSRRRLHRQLSGQREQLRVDFRQTRYGKEPFQLDQSARFAIEKKPRDKAELHFLLSRIVLVLCWVCWCSIPSLAPLPKITNGHDLFNGVVTNISFRRTGRGGGRHEPDWLICYERCPRSSAVNARRV